MLSTFQSKRIIFAAIKIELLGFRDFNFIKISVVINIVIAELVFLLCMD